MQSTHIRRTILAITGTAAALASPAVLAHIGVDGGAHLHEGDAMSSFMAGAIHPLTGFDHLAAMVSVGLWSVLGLSPRASSSGQGSPSFVRGLGWSCLAAPTAFAAMLMIGALLGLAGMTLPGIEPMIAASLLILGLLVATRQHLPMNAGAALVAAFALFHGLAHGTELQGGHAAAALSGMVISTVALHAAGIGLGLALRDQGHKPLRWLTRMAGAGVALFGLNLLMPAIASSSLI